jgi:hypothetical protein
LCESIVSLTTKGEGTSPLKLRPIGVMSVVYRLWAATRVREVMQWQELWIDGEMHGYRKSHGAEDVWWKQALQVEESLLNTNDLFGLSLDYGKCFDRVPVHLVLDLALEQGMSPRLVAPLRTLYARLQRRFRVGGGLGKLFHSTNGIIQGCPLSVVLLNLLVNVWARSVRAGAPSATPCAYADDSGATSTQAVPIQQVLNITGKFAIVTGQVLNAAKSHVWTTCSRRSHELDNMNVLGDLVPSTRGGRLLVLTWLILSMCAMISSPKGYTVRYRLLSAYAGPPCPCMFVLDLSPHCCCLLRCTVRPLAVLLLAP